MHIEKKNRSALNLKQSKTHFEKRNHFFFQTALLWLILTNFKKMCKVWKKLLRPSYLMFKSYNLGLLDKTLKAKSMRCLASLNSNFTMNTLVDKILFNPKLHIKTDSSKVDIQWIYNL